LSKILPEIPLLLTEIYNRGIGWFQTMKVNMN
jgi:hypothetical protein